MTNNRVMIYVLVAISLCCFLGCQLTNSSQASRQSHHSAGETQPLAETVGLETKMKQLEELLSNPQHDEGIKRRFLCRDLGDSLDRRTIPLLLKALDDPYINVRFTNVEGVGGTDAQWYAVWREADEALRKITGVNPVEQPKQRMPDYSGKQQKAIRDAWLKWWDENAEQADAAGRPSKGRR